MKSSASVKAGMSFWQISKYHFEVGKLAAWKNEKPSLFHCIFYKEYIIRPKRFFRKFRANHITLLYAAWALQRLKFGAALILTITIPYT